MRTRLLIIFVLIFALGFIGTALACECKESTVEQRIENAQVIFSGKLYGDVWESSDHHMEGNFAVKKTWKGAESFPSIKTGNVKVVTAVDSGLCGVKFVPNKDYLIFAQIDGENLRTSSCSGSWFLDGRGNEVRALEKIGSTHVFIDAREIKGKNSECGGPGLTSKEQCEFDNIIRQVVLPLAVTAPIVGASIFLIWRKRK